MAAAGRPMIVDIHTHVYTPAYVELLRRRAEVPRVVRSADGEERVILLKEEVSGDGSNSKGRPVGPQYWDSRAKLSFMDAHGIDVSVVSLANPWLDFLGPTEAVETARKLNDELEAYCASAHASNDNQTDDTSFSPLTQARLFAFGSLPLVPGVEPAAVLEAVEQIQQSPHLRGVIMGTKGLGKGLDDPEMEPVYRALSSAGLIVFVHPHYGVENAFGEQDNGHVLALGLGFPLETTIGIARLILAGVLDRHPDLKLLLAHSAGALPALSSRLASCITHDPHVKDRLQTDFRFYLGQMWYDALAYGPEELALVERVISRAGNYECRDEELPFIQRVNGRADLLAPVAVYPGVERLLFGTDHPFFPPLEGDSSARWPSVDENLDAIAGVPGWGKQERDRVLGQNAVELFGLEAKGKIGLDRRWALCL
ncbi:hypothetical protein BMF94_0510 [Rhodotorula taiwanensis]|uniref:Amidohydrolase-related domain-containing protein n=1 Tax=Rhodotorula taiwanensis TaxID=741276 RepID=A0A2S5BHT7_9BASI|nr:hypothetical protein BMF94_0510 [Rhodotorula taiwanensis]